MKRSVYVLAASALFAAQTSVAEPVTIRYDAWPSQDKELESAKADLKKKLPNIEVKPLMNQWTDHHTKLTTNLATGSGAGDVVAIDVEKIGPFIDGGGFVNLSKKYGANKLEKIFPAYAWAQGKDKKGDIYAIPRDLGPGVMFYRRDHMEDKGFKVEDISKSWDTFIEYGKELKKKGVFLVADAGIIAQAIINTTVEPGNSLYFNSRGKVIVTNKRFVKAFTLAKKVRDMKLDARIGSWSNEWFEALKKGTYAIEFSGAWLGGFLEAWIAPEAKGQWGSANLPEGIYGSWGGGFLAIPKMSKKQDEAWKFIEYFTTSEKLAIDRLKVSGAFPAVLTSYNDSFFDQCMPYFRGQKARRHWATLANKVKPIKPYKGDNVARAIILENALPAVLNEGKDVEKALAEAARLIKRRMRNL